MRPVGRAPKVNGEREAGIGEWAGLLTWVSVLGEVGRPET